MNIDEKEEDNKFKNDIWNYKGYFVENADEEEDPKYFEFGAHFSYKELYKCLEILRNQQLKKEFEKEKENGLQGTKIQRNLKFNKKIENKERNNTKNKKIESKENNEKKGYKESKENKENNNFQNISIGLKNKARSRNLGGMEDAPDESEKQNELTFIPFSNSINNFPIKKEQKNPNKSTSINNANYIKIYCNNKKKKMINLNNNFTKTKKVNNFIRSTNSNLNTNINTSNINNTKDNAINKNFGQQYMKYNKQINRLNDKHIISRNREQKHIYQKINNIYNNQTVHQNYNNINNSNNNFNEINYFQSYQMQTKVQPISSIYKKLCFLNKSSLNYNSKENISNSNNIYHKRIKQLTEPKISINSLKKHIIVGNKNIQLNKIVNNSTSYMNTSNKMKGRLNSNNLNDLLNSYNSKKMVLSSEKKFEKLSPLSLENYYFSYKYNNMIKNKRGLYNFSLEKKKLNEFSDSNEYKKYIPVSVDNNRNNLSNNDIINRINKENNKKQYSFLNIIHNNNISYQGFSNQSKKNYLNKENKNSKCKPNNNNDNNWNDNSQHINYEGIKENMNNLFNITGKNEKISRNKNNNYFINNISSINNSNNKIINSINSNINFDFNNNTSLKKMNMTQQSNSFVKYNNQKNQLRAMIFNFNKKLINNNNKKVITKIPSLPGQKIFTTSTDDNSIFNNNNYKSKFINKQLKNNKVNSYYLNNSIINKPKKKINLTKDIIYKPKLKMTDISKNNNNSNGNIINNNNAFKNINNDTSINKKNISKNISKNQMSNLSNNSYLLKKYENIIKKKSPKKNINININISNNNKIIYNRIFGDKNPFLRNNQKNTKSPTKQKIGFVNNTTYGNANNVINKKGQKNSGMISIDNLKKKKGNNIKFDNLQFPKKKLLNIYNKNNNI